MKTKMFIAALLFIGLGTLSYAQSTNMPVARERQGNQAARIKQGKNSGELTRKETAGLRAQQANIRQEKREAKADGTVTKRERAEIQARQNNASRRIHNQKNDAQKRPN